MEVNRKRQRRRLRNDLPLLLTTPLYQGYGSHYVALNVGTSSKPQTLIVDTGSSHVAFPCSDCAREEKKCQHDLPHTFHAHAVYPTSSSTAFRSESCGGCSLGECSEEGRCTFGVSYQEGSNWTAYEAVDVVSWGGSSPLEVRLACQTALSGQFVTQLADGMLGLDISPTSFWNQLFLSKRIRRRSFAVCGFPTTVRQPAGVLSLGGFDPVLHQSTMMYANFSPETGFYGVTLRKMYLQHHDQQSPQLVTFPETTPSQMIIDTGTTSTYLVNEFRASFASIWEEMTSTVYTNGALRLSKEEIAQLPTVILQLAGVSTSNRRLQSSHSAAQLDPEHPYDLLVRVPPSHYMELENGEYSSGFFFEDSDSSVMGANALQYHNVYFDIDGERIGFAESRCNYADIQNKTTFNLRKRDAQHGSDPLCQSPYCRVGVVLGFSTLLVGVAVVLYGKRKRRVKPRSFPPPLQSVPRRPLTRRSVSLDEADNDAMGFRRPPPRRSRRGGVLRSRSTQVEADRKAVPRSQSVQVGLL